MGVEIPKTNALDQKVFDINNAKDFHAIALEVFEFQFMYNPVYQAYCRALGKTPDIIHQVSDIPYLPIEFFKTHRVATTSFVPALVFKSSGTTGNNTSTHYIRDANLYQQSFELTFHKRYGPVASYCLLALLPSYLERGQSSLVYMMDHLIRQSGHIKSGFYLNNYEQLNKTLLDLEASGQKTILMGVTYALLDFSAMFPQKLCHTIVMETGGMKGRSKEILKKELYDTLKEAFGIQEIHAEYGMTELLSQAYAVEGYYHTPPWMKLLVRDETDPLYIYPENKDATGGINIIDLANLYSCSFIATDDVARRERNRMEILGRLDHSDIRGCSLLTL